MNDSSILRSILRMARTHGRRAASYDVAFRAFNKCVYYRKMQCLVIETINEHCLALPSQFRFVKLQPEELFEYAKTDTYELTPGFLRAVLKKGDECYAILDGKTIASYGWYSRRPTSLDNQELILRFDRNYVYMYKGFTLASYRGQRLHAIGMTRALAEYKAIGFKGLVSYVESNNFDSLRSCFRMGYQYCGHIRVFRVGGRYIVRRQSSVEKYGLAVDMV